jgi:tRNA pseudouridine55 synthase
VTRDVAAAADAGTRKLPVCHAGTLDPFASGLLVVALGQATRAVDLLHDVPKEYEAEVAWGAETDSGDPLGTVIAIGDTSDLDPRRLADSLAEHVGWRDQVPPTTSAQRVDGEYAYRKAHRGELFTLPARSVFLHEARWLGHDPGRATSRLFLRCGRGYYVRSLARDLGRALGCRAHLRALRRTAIGPWTDPADRGTESVTGDALFPWLPARVLDEDEARRVAHGQPLPEGVITPPTWNVPAGFPPPSSTPIRALFQGRLVALLRPDAGGRLAPFANLRGGL